MKGRQIPAEPAYIMFNIDVSPKWGWPGELPVCYDCSNKTCTKNPDFWFQQLCDTLPWRYEIDWIRLWQRGNHTNISCSPEDYPTQGWIQHKDNRENYISQNMNEPLRPVFPGGAECQEDHECGYNTSHGTCTDNVCHCTGDWTGPRCLVKRVGASSICRSLEEIVVGGAACFSDSETDCGREHNQGACHKVKISSGAIQYHQKDGVTKRVGGGDGRCGCGSDWGGPTCNEKRTIKTCLSPDPSWNGSKLEDYVEETCRQNPWFQKKPVELENACNDVLSEYNGKYAGCGAWLRASWVAKAAPCPIFRTTWFWVVVIAAGVTLCVLPVLWGWGRRRWRGNQNRPAQEIPLAQHAQQAP